MDAYRRLMPENSNLQRRRRSLQVLIARYEKTPHERDQLLAMIRKEQERLKIYKRDGDASDALSWVDGWKPRQLRRSGQSVLQAFMALV